MSIDQTDNPVLQPGVVVTPGRLRDDQLRIIALAAAIVALIATVAAARLAQSILAPTVVSGLIALTLAPVVAFASRRGVPDAVGAGAVVGLGLSGFVAGAYALAPSAEEWRMRVPSIVRSLEWKLRDLERTIQDNVDSATGGAVGGDGGEKSTTEAVIESGQELLTDMVLATPEAIATFLYMAFLSYFLLVERASVHRFLLGLSNATGMRLRIARSVRDVRGHVGRYLLTITVINVALGVLAGTIFALLGLPNAPLWGTLVALLNFMPYLGPMMANAIVFAAGFATFGDVGTAAYPVLALVILNVIEGQMVTPLIVGRSMRVGALSVFVALAFGAWLWGAVGALIATPMLIVGQGVWRRMTNSH